MFLSSITFNINSLKLFNRTTLKQHGTEISYDENNVMITFYTLSDGALEGKIQLINLLNAR